METKSLLFGLVGFFLGGLIVSVAATQLDSNQGTNPSSEMSMSQMTNELSKKTGDDYDKAFIAYMIDHHQAAVDMAKLSAERASHQEIKDLSVSIITAQEKEISEMKQWQTKWGYSSTDMNHMGH